MTDKELAEIMKFQDHMRIRLQAAREECEYYDWVKEWLEAHDLKLNYLEMQKDRRAYILAKYPDRNLMLTF